MTVREGDQLAGRTAIVTGAGSGIGRATACRLAGAGAYVVVNDLSERRAAETTAMIVASGGAAEAAAGDVTAEGTVDGLVDGLVNRRGRLDVLHSNAGAGLAQGPLVSITDDGWRADLDLNLTAMFFCVRAAARVMGPAGGGSIVCTSSGAGVGAVVGTSSYAAAKAAILALVRSAAVEHGGQGVRVNAVIPGAVLTDAFRSYIGTEERLARYARQIPLGRMASPEDIADAVLFLASDQARSVTGTSLLIDGGVGAKRAEPIL